MNKENKLGMGLGALLSNSNNNKENNNGIQKINISQITPNPSQPRKNFRDEELKELSSSIKNQGLIQPIIVKPTIDNQFQIIAGERRWRACQLNEMHEVDCVIKDIDDTNILEAALIENIQREDLNVIEEANAYKGLIDIKATTKESLAKSIGKSSSHVSNILRLLELDEKIQQMVIDGDLSMGHARALIGVPNAINKAKEIIERKLSVRQVEKIAFPMIYHLPRNLTSRMERGKEKLLPKLKRQRQRIMRKWRQRRILIMKERILKRNMRR